MDDQGRGGALESLIRVSSDLEAIDCAGFRAELAKAAPLRKEEIGAWAITVERSAYSDQAGGGERGARYVVGWSDWGPGGPCMRALTRDASVSAMLGPRAYRIFGRLFERAGTLWESEMILGPACRGLFDSNWRLEFELRLIESPAEWAKSVAEREAFMNGREAPIDEDWPAVELMDPEELVVSLCESRELEASVERAPAPARPRPGI